MSINKNCKLINFIEDLKRKIRFSKYYYFNGFAGNESVSGEGSGDKQTDVIRKELPRLIKKYKIKSLVDAPCGDNYWISKINIYNAAYVGIDIVRPLIQANIKKYSSSNKLFLCKDLTEYIVPKSDLILCRDLLVHLTYKDAIQILHNFKKSGSKYLLATTFDEHSQNTDLSDKIWRPLNLQKCPFYLPKPIFIINEKCTEENSKYVDKKLALWDLRTLKI